MRLFQIFFLFIEYIMPVQNIEKSRSYCITLNNYSDLEYTTLYDLECRYLIIGKEVGESGTPHLQCYVYFDNPRGFRAIHKKFPRAHLENVLKGTPQQASEYCKKEGDFIEKGSLPEQGIRNDLSIIREVLKETNSMEKVVEVATSYQSVKMAEQILKYTEKPRTWKPMVLWFWGETGTGKTRTAYEMLGSRVYTCMGTGKWFDGYDAHEDVLIDDMRENFMSYNDFLRFIDRYAYRVETKGGTRQFLAKRIIITTPLHPNVLFTTKECINQVIRRIDEIRYFGIPEI